jgi:hypothetical protein
VKIVVSQDVAAVWLMENPKENAFVDMRFETVDVSNGRVTGLYYPAEALGETAVDFKRQDGFTFLDADDNGKIRLLTAAPR